MAQQFQDSNGNVITIPGTTINQQVINSQSGIAVSGVVTAVGEADAGPQWAQESDIENVGFTPDQLNSVLQKYGSGKLVDAFRAIISGNGDPQISGSVQKCFLVKTNTSSKSKLSLLRSGFGQYSDLIAARAGADSNLISSKISTLISESAPLISSVGAYPRVSGSSVLSIRVNGSAETDVTISAGQSPASIASAIESVSGILCQGGVNRDCISVVSGTLALAVSGSNALITRSINWNSKPQVGDTLYIPSGSVLAGVANANVGSYRVLSATSSTVTAKPEFITGSLIAVSTTSEAAASDLQDYSPMSIRNATGMDRQIIDLSSDKISITNITPSSIKISYLDSSSSAKLFASTPQVGELLYVPSSLGSLSSGWYQISSVINSGQGQLGLSRLSNGSLSGSPSTVSLSSTSDLQALKSDIDGLGKSLEVNADSNAQSMFLNSSTGTSLTSLNSLVISSAERQAQVLISKPAGVNPVTQTFNIGGSVVLAVGYEGASCIMSLTPSLMTTSASGSGDDLSIDLTQITTLQQLVDLINSKPNYSASVANNQYTNMNPAQLDSLSLEIASSDNAKPGRIKRDAQDFINKMSSSSLVQIDVIPDAGLPDSALLSSFMSGGAKGASLGVDFVNAIDACELISSNFIVPLVDQDAASDIAEGTTDANSTYSVDAVNAYAKSHVIAESSVKSRKNRMAICSKWASSYSEAKQAARDLSNPRVVLCFGKCKDVSPSGQIALYPAWRTSCKVAGQSSAAGFKGIVNKLINITGIQYPQGFDPRRNGDLEDALLSGLLIIKPVSTGGFSTVSDQTTYNLDNNFVYNSIQAVYLSDLITLQLIQDSDRVLVGQSIAQTSAAVIRGFMQAEMTNFLKKNWIARSDDAPLGYKSLTVNLNGGVAEISIEVKLAGLLYFVSINLALSEVTQTA